jgi:hypothetical protein
MILSSFLEVGAWGEEAGHGQLHHVCMDFVGFAFVSFVPAAGFPSWFARMADDMIECPDRTMCFWPFGFYTAWMMGIAALAYQKLKGFDDYATHFVGRKDYGVFVM